MSFYTLPKSLEMDKLFLDVRLEAIPMKQGNINQGSDIDLTGTRTFTIGMMRENKGFGITDIQIETKTSLQPIIDITFKDLYGNTLFEGVKSPDANGDNFNYDILFAWPPPKFKFTFKGYLGKSVTWIMNLKKTNTRYNSSDNSYEIKASFVPNIWGFLADIPFLYLLAKKRLKRDVHPNEGALPNATKQQKIESIFDIIKIGKTIETKKKQVTKEFDKLQKQLSVLKANAISGLINKDIAPNEVIDGQVAGRQPIKGIKNVSGQSDLPNFTSIKITLPQSLSVYSNDSAKLQTILQSLNANQQLAEHNKIIALIGNPGNSNKIDMSVLGVFGGDTSTGVGASTNVNSFQTAVQQNQNGTTSTVPFVLQYSPVVKSDINTGNKIIDDNLKLIDIETQRRVFETSETELGAVTISEVFSRLAADGGYILGSILDAGYQGYSQNTTTRNSNTLGGNPLIGSYFPLTLDISQGGEQIPAIAAGIEGEGCEMSFVRRFLTAISEGIAENQASQNQDALNNSDNKLVARINNLEIVNSNPYKDASGQQFLETLLVRSGIAAYITRSFDSNVPGDYNTSFWSAHEDQDSSDEITQLATKELKNITDLILSSLSAGDYSRVKNFCKFINNLFTPDGDNFFNLGVGSTIIPIPSDINVLKNTISYISSPSASNPTGVASQGTIDSVFKQFIGKTSIFYQGAQQGLSDSINYEDFTAKYLYNNNTLWMLPNVSDKNSFIVFDNASTIGAIDSVQNNDTDSQFNSKDNKESSEPLGIVKVSNGYSDNTNNPDEHKRLEAINKYILKSTVLDYSKLQGLNFIPLIPSGQTNAGYVDITQFLYSADPSISNTTITQTNIGNGITYLVYSQVTSDADPRLTWGLFRPSHTLGDVRGRNQRIFLRTLCVDIERRMSTIETEKNNVLSQVLGKAQSNENSLYIQMHHIFHEWSVLGFKMVNATANTNKSSDGFNKTADQQIALGHMADELEKEYGTIIDTIDNKGVITQIRSVEDPIGTPPTTPSSSTSSTGFLYDFPMEKFNPPSVPTVVGNSIINIEPLYKPNANTTLLNIIQQLCTKNNFMFIPNPGNINYSNLKNVFLPSTNMQPAIGNVFHVLFTPTPESRIRENDNTSIHLTQNAPKGSADAFEIVFGSVDNSIIKNIDVSTDESRPTAESILNLQRLVDKDNSNKVVTTDCSILSVMEGRSYKMKVEMIGNAQISPMQYFYVASKPIFSGLYQVMNVTHSIKPNDMSTTLEGIKMRFDGKTSMRGIGPITLESLRALGTASQPNVNATGPTTSNTGAVLQGLLSPYLDVPNTSDLDLIPGTYLNNAKKSITLVQIDGRPVEIFTAKAYLTMKSAALKDGIKLSINSGFRPQFGENLNVVSTKGVLVLADSQHVLRVANLEKPNYPDPNNVTNPQGNIVNVDSATLKPQVFHQVSPNNTQGYFKNAVAVPGSSKHGNGTALDLNTGTRLTNSLHSTPLQNTIYVWLVTNGWKYGFVRTVNTEEWHFEYRPDLAKLGPYGGFAGMYSSGTFIGSSQSRNTTLFYTDLGLSNLIMQST